MGKADDKKDHPRIDRQQDHPGAKSIFPKSFIPVKTDDPVKGAANAV
jgi:hypothetical protein